MANPLLKRTRPRRAAYFQRKASGLVAWTRRSFLIKSKIDDPPKGTMFDAKTLMGEKRTSILNKKSFGREFKKALADSRLTGIIHDHLDNSLRRDIYKKSSQND